MKLLKVTLPDSPLPKRDPEILDLSMTKAKILKYIKTAPVILRSPGLLPDFADHAQPRVVPGSIRSDGTWIWPESAAYYFEHYNLDLPAEFTKHVIFRETPPKQLSSADVEAALDQLKSGSK